MNGGPSSEWYAGLNKAPWTPPGWLFGAAWTTIMLCFSWYLAVLFNSSITKEKTIFYVVQVFLNVIWNWVFFNKHWTLSGLIVIIALTALIGTFFFAFREERLKQWRLLLLPYVLWLLIATSLNAYVVIYN
jgi:tryptophan-rich sensory protein